MIIIWLLYYAKSITVVLLMYTALNIVIALKVSLAWGIALASCSHSVFMFQVRKDKRTRRNPFSGPH